MRLNALRGKKAALVRECDALLVEAGEAPLAADAKRQFDAKMDEIDGLNARIADEERHAMEQRTTVGRVPEDVFGLGGNSHQVPDSGSLRRNGRKFAQMFSKVALTDDGWEKHGGFNAFLETLTHNQYHPALKAAASEGSGPGGGFMSPTQYASRMWDNSLEDGIVRPRADVWPMTSDTLKIAGFDSSDNSTGSLYGGITGEWLQEGGPATDQIPQVRKLELKAKKLAVFTASSNELVADGIDYVTQLEAAMTKSLAWHLDYAFLRGTGVGQPLGVLNDPALVTVAAEGAQAADSIVYENIANMFARLHPSCMANAVWVANSTTIPQLLTLSVTIGLGGQHVPVLQNTGGEFRMLTRPVLFTEKLPVLGDEGDIILVDFSQYAIGLRSEMAIEASRHIYWSTDQTAYRTIVRVDGQGKWSSAFSPRNGDSQSWCVALAAR